MSNESQIVKAKKSGRFTVIPNDILRNNSLSLKAKGLLCLLISLPDNWTVNKTQLPNFSKDGYDATCAAFSELEQLGYIKTQTIRDEKGRFLGYQYVVHEEPVLTTENEEPPIRDFPVSDNPVSENPITDNPISGNPQLRNTDSKNTDIRSNILHGSNLFRKPRIPSLSEVQEVFARNQATDEMAQAFFDKYSATEWYINNSPIRNFASLVPNFIRNWRERDKPSYGQQAPAEPRRKTREDFETHEEYLDYVKKNPFKKT